MADVTATTDPRTGFTTTNRSPRFLQWICFLGFSVVSLGSAVEIKNTSNATGSALTNQRWAIACSSITCGLTVLMCLAMTHSISAAVVVGTKIEGVLVIVLTAFWAGTVSIVSDARNGLAVNTGGTVENGNLYYFSWAGFVCSVMLVVSYLRAVFGVDVASELRNRSGRLTIWSALLAAQLVVMGSCANVFDQDCAPRQTKSEEYCARTKFGISVGVIGTAFSLGVVGMKVATSQAPFLLEMLFAFFLLLLNGFGTAYLTSARGPGSGIGNLYYFSWISSICAFMASASCLQDYRAMTSGEKTDEGHSSGTPAENDIPVEPLEKVDDV